MEIQLPTPPGVCLQQGLTHEIAHCVIAHRLLGSKLPAMEIRSHLHPENDKSYMSIHFDWDYFFAGNNLDYPTIRQHIDQMACVYVAGGVSEELWYGVKFEENKYAGADLDILRQFADKTGEDYSSLVAQRRQTVREILSQPGAMEIIQLHAGLYEQPLFDDSKVWFNECHLGVIFAQMDAALLSSCLQDCSHPDDQFPALFDPNRAYPTSTVSGHTQFQ